MWVLILLVAAVLAVLILGPTFVGLLMLAAALGAGAIATLAILGFGLVAMVVALLAAGWVLWWTMDPKGAMKAKRDAEGAFYGSRP